MSGSAAGPRERRAIGIDVGGTKVAMALVREGGELGSIVRFENREAGDPGRLLMRVASECRRLLSLPEADGVEAIGIGLPELVDARGEVRSASTLPWTRADILAAFEGMPPVVLEADVRAAALAEARFGAGRGYRSMGYVTIGTGVSSCTVLDGTPLAGSHGSAQLLGSTEVPVRCPACGHRCGLVLEAVVGGPGIAASYGRLTGRTVRGAEEVIAAASAGDPAASQVLEEAGELLGSFLALYVGVVDPEVLVLGGGIGSTSGAYWDEVVRWTRRYIWAEHVRDIPILRAALGAASGIVGAGLAALEIDGGSVG